MERMLVVGLWQANMLNKTPDEYEEDGVDWQSLGVAKNRKIKKAGVFRKDPVTIDLSEVQYGIGGKLANGEDGVRVIFKTGGHVTIVETIDTFDLIWAQYKAIMHGQEWLAEDIDKERQAKPKKKKTPGKAK